MDMKSLARNCLLLLLTTVLLCSAFVFALAESNDVEPVYRTDLTEEDFLGTWNLKSMIVEGYSVPTESLNLHATVIVTPGQIEITDVLGVTNTYETTFEEDHLVFMKDDQKMLVYITEDGLLHVDQEAGVFVGSADDEGAPVVKGGTGLNLGDLGSSLLSQYFEKVED